MIAGLAGGLMVDRFAQTTSDPVHGYAFLFVVASLFGEAATLMALKVPEPERRAARWSGGVGRYCGRLRVRNVEQCSRIDLNNRRSLRPSTCDHKV
jgi:hypothetical protein